MDVNQNVPSRRYTYLFNFLPHFCVLNLLIPRVSKHLLSSYLLELYFHGNRRKNPT